MKKAPPLSGLTWSDVYDWVEDYETEYGVHVYFELMSAHRALGRPMGLTVTLKVVGTRDSGKRGFERRYKASWPTYGHKTMPGLLLYLLHSSREDLIYRPPQYRLQRKTPAYAPD